MAAPINLEDLAKLKTFVEFVAANPTILNMPQLDFFKKLIEQFGGTVPEGTFQMPAGAKCPFGGDVKSENKSTSPPTAAEEDEEEISEMEAESEESDVELDMGANNMMVVEPRILYLDEKPLKIVKSKKIPKKTIKIKTRQKNLGKRRAKLNQENIIKEEVSSFSKEQKERLENNQANDPLSTGKLEYKCEEDEENQNDSNDFEQDDNVDDDHDYDYEYDKMQSQLGKKYYEDDDKSEEDEPFIMLSRRKERTNQKFKGQNDVKTKAPRSYVCGEKCMQHCREKFSEKQRKSICDYFWNLNKSERLEFIRKHTRVRRVARMKRLTPNKIRSSNCSYYLKNYRIGCKEPISSLTMDHVRVCHKFFAATLRTSSHLIKKANSGPVMDIEEDLYLQEIKLIKDKEEKRKRNQESQQILDPETGNLIPLNVKTTEPKDKTPLVNTSKKYKRRKKGDPVPEHFPKPLKCEERCIHKCHTKFTEEKRKDICDFFWSMDFKRRKDFVLTNIEIKDIESETAPDFRKTNRPPRAYQTRFFMRSGGTRGDKLRVCRDFFARTLSIQYNFIKNAIQFADKTTGCYTGSDRRGAHESATKISDERKQIVIDHINSYPYWVPSKKTKTKYLHHSLTIKKMYDAYKEKCLADNLEYVALHYYYRLFHAHFNILFLANTNPKKGRGYVKSNPNLSQYVGNEAGGCWLDSKGKKLNIQTIKPDQTLDYQRYFITDNSLTNANEQTFPIYY